MRTVIDGSMAADVRARARDSGQTARQAELTARTVVHRAAQRTHDWMAEDGASLLRCRRCLRGWRGSAPTPACPGAPVRIAALIRTAQDLGHQIHAAVSAMDAPLIACMRCGGWSDAGVVDTRRKLGRPCEAATAYGADALRRLRDGRHPSRNSACRAGRWRRFGLVVVNDADQ